MRIRLAAAFLLAAGFAGPALAGGLDSAVLAEVNWARAHPAEYARELDEQPPQDIAYNDPEALDDAVAFLMRQSPLPPLREDARLAAAAESHAVAQGPSGEVGHHATAGGLGERLARQGVHAGLAAEDISYGYESARDVVRQLIVDSGVPGRGHRANIFGRAYQAAGVGCGPHSTYGAMCVIDFAGAMIER